MTMTAERKKRLQKISDGINKAFGAKGDNAEKLITYIGDNDYEPLERWSSGSPDLDDALGGGWPRGRMVEIYGPESGGKCHAKGTKILMFDGHLKNVEDIEVGDWVMGPDSKPRQVQALARGSEMMYRVTPRKGLDNSFVVNENHILSLKNTEIGSRFGEIVDISLKDFLEKSDNFRYYHKLYQVPVEWAEKSLPVDPYFLGLWLGDGSSDSVRIYTQDDEVVSALEEYGDRIGHSLSVVDDDGERCPGYSLVVGKGKYQSEFCLQGALHSLGVMSGKHIPHVFKTGSRNQRLELLAGLLDSDGYKGASKLVFCNTNKTLAEDVLFVARSLGFFCNMKEYTARLGDFTCPAFKVYINGDCSVIPLRVSRKRPTERVSNRDPLVSSFDVEPVGVGEFFGFVLDGDHRYLMGNFIVQHNTTICYHAVSEFQKVWPNEDIAWVDSEYCFAESAIIYDAETRTCKTVKELHDSGGKFKVLSVCRDGAIKIQDAVVSKSGVRMTYLVKCSYGRELHLTENHRVLTSTGYKRVDELVPGNILYAPVEIPSTETNSQNDDFYRLLGYHIGDGTIGKAEIATIDDFIKKDIESIVAPSGCKVSFSGKLARISKEDLCFYDIKKEELVEHFSNGGTISECASRFGCSPCTVKERIDEYGLNEEFDFRSIAAFARSERKMGKVRATGEYRGGKQSPIFDKLSQFPCFSKHSHERRIPDGLSKIQLAQVLAGMFMADGHTVNPDKNHRCCMGYSSTSKFLAHDFQHALLQFGIFSSIRCAQKYDEEGDAYEMSYVVWISGEEDVRKFVNNIPIFGYKKDYAVTAITENRTTVRKSFNEFDNLVEIEVKSVEEDIECQTYDIGVLNNDDYEQNLLAEGVFVHNSLDPDYAEKIGVTVDTILHYQPTDGNQALEVIRHLIRDGVKLIIVDSVAALSPRAEMEGSLEDSTRMAGQAAMMSQGLRIIQPELGRADCTILFTNQMRDKPGVMWGEKATTPAGRALKFYASVRVDVRAVGQEKEGEMVVSMRTKALVKKNKTAPPLRIANFIISFGIGIDKVAGVFDAAVEVKAIQKSGAWFNLGEKRIGQGRANCLNLLRQNNDLLNDVLSKLKAAKMERVAKKAAKMGDGSDGSDDSDGSDEEEKPSKSKGKSSKKQSKAMKRAMLGSEEPQRESEDEPRLDMGDDEDGGDNDEGVVDVEDV